MNCIHAKTYKSENFDKSALVCKKKNNIYCKK